jgi:hypothetical protein
LRLQNTLFLERLVRSSRIDVSIVVLYFLRLGQMRHFLSTLLFELLGHYTSGGIACEYGKRLTREGIGNFGDTVEMLGVW